MADKKASKNSRVVRRGAEPIDVPKHKRPFWLFPVKPGKPVNPCGYYLTKEEAEEAKKNFPFKTEVGFWIN